MRRTQFFFIQVAAVLILLQGKKAEHGVCDIVRDVHTAVSFGTDHEKCRYTVLQCKKDNETNIVSDHYISPTCKFETSARHGHHAPVVRDNAAAADYKASRRDQGKPVRTSRRIVNVARCNINSHKQTRDIRRRSIGDQIEVRRTTRRLDNRRVDTTTMGNIIRDVIASETDTRRIFKQRERSGQSDIRRERRDTERRHEASNADTEMTLRDVRSTASRRHGERRQEVNRADFQRQTVDRTVIAVDHDSKTINRANRRVDIDTHAGYRTRATRADETRTRATRIQDTRRRETRGQNTRRKTRDIDRRTGRQYRRDVRTIDAGITTTRAMFTDPVFNDKHDAERRIRPTDNTARRTRSTERRDRVTADSTQRINRRRVNRNTSVVEMHQELRQKDTRQVQRRHKPNSERDTITSQKLDSELPMDFRSNRKSLPNNEPQNRRLAATRSTGRDVDTRRRQETFRTNGRMSRVRTAGAVKEESGWFVSLLMKPSTISSVFVGIFALTGGRHWGQAKAM